MRTASLLWILGPALAGGVAVSKVAVGRAPGITARFTDGVTPRVVVACRDERPSHLELDAAVAAYGARPLGPRAVAALARREGQVTCVLDDDPAAARGILRLRPMQLSAVTPSLVRDAMGARVLIAIDGQALGPKTGSEDGVYLVARGRLIHLDASCPEARYSNERVVECIDATSVAGLASVKVRLQSAGRLEQAPGAPVDLAALVAR